MPYDEKLAKRIDRLLAESPGVSRKNMFGGICYLLKGNMFSGIYRESLILRLGEKGAAEALKSGHVRPMDITGRPMKGWVMVDPEGFRSENELDEWLNEAAGYADGLPAKDRNPNPRPRRKAGRKR